MNNKFFSFRLMKEGMRQTKMVGTISVILMALASFFSMMLISTSTNYATYDSMGNYTAERAVSHFGFLDLNPFVYFVMYTMVPLMVLILFGFLNKRKSSDFYHSIPYTRVCMAVSFMASILAWAVIVIALGAVITFVLVQFNTSIVLDYSSMWFHVVCSLVGSFYVAAAVLLGVSLTGTYFTNVLVSMMIIFAPRTLSYFVTNIFFSELPFITRNTDIFSDVTYNMVFAVPTDSAQDKTIIYTLIVGLAYLVLGIVFFKLRKSENATRASVNRKLQCVLRLIPAFLVSLIGINSIYLIHTGSYERTTGVTVEIVIAYVVALVVYFIYEAVTTRSVKNMVRAIPGVAILVALNLALIFSMCYGYDKVINERPTPDEISYVEVIPSDDILFLPIKYTSEEVTSVLGDCLGNTMDMWKYNRYGDNGGEGYYRTMYRSVVVDVDFHLKNGTVLKRQVIVDDLRYDRFKNAILSEEDFVGKATLGLDDSSIVLVNAGDLSDAGGIYNVFRNELKNKSLGELADFIYKNTYNNDTLFRIRYAKGNRHGYINIGYEFPETVVAYANAVNSLDNQNPVEWFMDGLDEMEAMDESSSDYDYRNIEMSISFSSMGSSIESYYIYATYEGGVIYMPNDKSFEMIKDALGLIGEKRDDIAADELNNNNWLVSISCRDSSDYGFYDEAPNQAWYIVDFSTGLKLRDLMGLTYKEKYLD